MRWNDVDWSEGERCTVANGAEMKSSFVLVWPEMKPRHDVCCPGLRCSEVKPRTDLL